MDHIAPADLPAAWRERAQLLREYGGDPPASKIWEKAAAELEDALHCLADETLNLTEAAKASGYSPDHLGQLVKRGKIRNLGRKGAPRVRRSDLPMKLGTTPPEPRRSSQPRPSKRIKVLTNELR